MNTTIPTNSKTNQRKLKEVEQLLIPIPKAKEVLPKRDLKKEKKEMLEWLNSVSFE